MTYDQIIQQLTQDVLAAIASAYPDVEPKPQVQVSIPTDKEKADFVTNVAFQLAKAVGAAPVAIAQAIVAQLENAQLYTAQAAAPGFINFKTSNQLLGTVLKDIIVEGADFGRGTSLEGQIWAIEHTSPNPNKAMHIGHLRNNLIGMSVAQIVEFSGAKVVRDAIDNNRGIAIAKAMWGYLHFKHRDGQTDKDVAYWAQHQDEWLTPQEVGVKPDHFVGDCYGLAGGAIKQDESVDQQVRAMALAWEHHDADVWALWELIIGFAHTGMDMTLSRLGNRWDTVWHEHEHYEQGRDLIMAGLEKGIFKKLDDGAILTQLEDYKIPDTIVLKSDGTSLYITQDLALTRLKKETFKADKLLWVIGPEQSVAMKQVFAICDQLGIGSYDSFAHLAYGLVSITDESGVRKKMSSRGGTTLLIDDLLDDVKASLLAAGRDYSDMDAEQIAVGVTKFAILKPARNTNTVINIDQAISMEGDSGVYLLYTLARMNTLLEKGEQQFGLPEGAAFNADERELLNKLIYFPEKVRDALHGFSPNVIVEYLLDLAHDFNSLYAKERFITEDASDTAKKLAVTKATQQVFINGLHLLCIEPVSKI